MDSTLISKIKNIVKLYFWYLVIKHYNIFWTVPFAAGSYYKGNVYAVDGISETDNRQANTWGKHKFYVQWYYWFILIISWELYLFFSEV